MSALLGVLGGLGPAASCCFYAKLIESAHASRDQDHPDVLLLSQASVPDRSAFLLGKPGAANPLPALQAGIARLEQAGATAIAVPCITAHHFYDAMQASTQVPVLDIRSISAKALQAQGVQRAVLLATEGTYASGAFAASLEAAGVQITVPGREAQRVLMELIYDIKAGRTVAPAMLNAIAEPLCTHGAQSIILGCTELTCAMPASALYFDPLQSLAEALLAYAQPRIST